MKRWLFFVYGAGSIPFKLSWGMIAVAFLRKN
jgi:hypothetical protein